MKILIACGGSGGHIFPGIALKEALCNMNKSSRVYIVTSDRRIDTDIFKEEKLPYETLMYNPFPETGSIFTFVRFFYRLIRAISKSLRILRAQNPDCVVGLGGYVSGPVIVAAWLMRKPVLVHEQNVVPGLTNRFSAFFSDKICVTFDKTKSFFKRKNVVVTGNPIRSSFLKESLEASSRMLGLERGIFTILIMGGSQGSSFLNSSISSAIGSMDNERKDRLQIVHLTGKNDYESAKEIYEKMGARARTFPFLQKIGWAYDMADLIITRAGATAISEITSFGKPSILVPYPKARVHQKENAEFLAERGAGISVEERDLSPLRLKDLILKLMDDSKGLSEMSDKSRKLSIPDAAGNLARETLGLINAKH